MKKTPMKKKTGEPIKKDRQPKTIKMLDENPMFKKIPNDMKQHIMSYLARPVGRPPATPMMIRDAKKKNQIRMKLNKQSERALREGDFDGYIDIVEEMKANNFIGQKAYDNRVTTFITNMNKLIEQDPEISESEYVEQKDPTLDEQTQREMALDETSTDFADMILKQSQREVKIEEGAPVKLKVVEEFSEPSIPTKRTQEKMQEASLNRAIKQMYQKERETAVRKRLAEPKTRSQLADHFTSYNKSSEGKAKQVAFDTVTPSTRESKKLTYKDVPKKVQDDIRQSISDLGNENFGYDEVAFAWDNNLDEVTKERIFAGDLTNVSKINDLITIAKQTQKFVPDYLESLYGMSTEERQIAFHTELINMRMKTLEEKRQQKPMTNFDNNGAAGGGINQGIPLQEIKDDKDFIQPEIFENYEKLLDNKITDDAYVREMFKGIDPNSVTVNGGLSGGRAEEKYDDEYFERLNQRNNLQNDEEIASALSNIEILSGGVKDTLFGEQDLLSTRANNPDDNDNFQNDMPYMRDDNPAPLERGRNAQAVQEVDPAVIRQQDRNDTATTIALGLGVLNNAYHGVFGQSDIPHTRTGGQSSILDSMNQAMRLMGRRGLYGDDKGLNDNEMFEGRTLSSRMNDEMSFSNAKNPNYLDNSEKETAQNEIIKSLGLNQATAQGSTLPQLRQQEFEYKQADRRTAHDGYAFIKGGKRTQLMINSEFEP